MKDQLEKGQIYKVIANINSPYGNLELKPGNDFLVLSKTSNIKKVISDLAQEMKNQMDVSEILDLDFELEGLEAEVEIDNEEDCVCYTVLNLQTNKKETFSMLYIMSDISTIDAPVFGIYNSPEKSDLEEIDNFHELKTSEVFRKVT